MNIYIIHHLLSGHTTLPPQVLPVLRARLLQQRGCHRCRLCLPGDADAGICDEQFREIYEPCRRRLHVLDEQITKIFEKFAGNLGLRLLKMCQKFFLGRVALQSSLLTKSVYNIRVLTR